MVAKVAVPKYLKPRESIVVEAGATVGATVGVNVRNADGTLWVPTPSPAPGSSGSGTPSSTYVYWRNLLERPPNIDALAALTGSGVVRRTGDSTFDTAATTSDLPEGSNLYFTAARARAAVLFGPALPNTDTQPLKPGWAVCRWMAGYARADATIAGREEAVGVIAGNTDVAVGATIAPQIEGLLTLTVAQWLEAIGTPGGLAPGRRYGLAAGGEISLNLPGMALASVPVGSALTAEALHVRINRPVYL